MTPQEHEKTTDNIESENDDDDPQQESNPTANTTTIATPEQARTVTSQELMQRLIQNMPLSSTESIGRRNTLHRKTQSTALFSLIDSPEMLKHRMRSISIAEMIPSMEKFYPGSHLLDEVEDNTCFYLSLWLLPPPHIEKQLTKEIAKISLKYDKASSPFVPHVTIIGSIRCETKREIQGLSLKLQKGLQHTGIVPCRFYSSTERCEAMYSNEQLVWSQSCIAMMERSPEYMQLLGRARALLNLPQGEWMFPAPSEEPHMSKLYTTQVPSEMPSLPPDFEADSCALFFTTPGSVPGVSKWRQVCRITLEKPTINKKVSSPKRVSPHRKMEPIDQSENSFGSIPEF